MERKFSFTQKLILRNLCRRNKEITITGINSFGEHFLTKGKIARDAISKPRVSDDSIFVEFGKEKLSPESKHTKWIAPFALNLTENKDASALIIETIYDEKGKQIYFSENFEEIVDISKSNRKEYWLNRSDHKFKLLDPVTSELKKLVGMPITLEYNDLEFNGVLEKVKGVNQNGYPIIELFNGFEEDEVLVEENTNLYVLDKNGEKTLKLQSDPKIFHIARENNMPCKDFEKTL